MLISVKNLTKKYGDDTVLSGISFDMPDSQTLGVLGKPDSGKSTLVGILANCIAPDDGQVLIDDKNLLRHAREAKRAIGYVPERSLLYPDMTVDEFLKFVCRLKDLPKADFAREISAALDRTETAPLRGRLIANLSKYEQKRVSLAQAMIADPKLLIIDEPTEGLEPKQIIDMRRLIKQTRREHAILLASSVLHEVADICERTLILHRGRIVADDSIRSLTAVASEKSRIKLRLASEPALARALFAAVGCEYDTMELPCSEKGAYDYVIESDINADLRPALFSRAAELGVELLEMKRISVSLEDVYLQLTGEGGA